MDYRTVTDPEGLADEVIQKAIGAVLSRRVTREANVEQLRCSIALRAGNNMEADEGLDKAITELQGLIAEDNDKVAQLRAKMRSPIDDADIDKRVAQLRKDSLAAFERQAISDSTAHEVAVMLGEEDEAGELALRALWHHAGAQAFQAVVPDDPEPEPAADTPDEPAGAPEAT